MKELFLKTSQNSQERTCARVSFLAKSLWHRCIPVNFAKFLRPATLLKKRLWHKCFPVNFAKFLRTQPATLLKEKLWRKCFPVNSANLLRTPLLQSTSWRLLLKKKEKTKICSFTKCKVYFSCFKQKQPKEVFYKSKIIFTIFFAT